MGLRPRSKNVHFLFLASILPRLVPATSICGALSRFFSQVLHIGLSAISFSIRQILGHANCRACSGVEVKWSRLHHFKEHRSHQHQRGGTCTPALGHQGHPISWVLPPFFLEYAKTRHPTPYMNRCLPKLESRPLYTRHTHSPLPWAIARSSSCGKTWAERSRR